MAPSANPSSSDPTEDRERLLLTLDVARRAGDVRKKCGHRAALYAQLLEAGLPVVEGWCLPARALAGALDARLELRGLIRASGTPGGDERCGRAHDELLAAPPSERLSRELEGLCRVEAAASGFRVRASVVGAEGIPGDLVERWSHAERAAPDVGSLLAAIRRVLAASVTPLQVAWFAELGLRDPSLALVVERCVPGARVLVVAPRRAPGGDTFRVLRAPEGSRSAGAAGLPASYDASLASSEPDPDRTERVRRDEPEEARLVALAAQAERALGYPVVLTVAVGDAEPPTLSVIDVKEAGASSRQRDAAAGWLELLPGRARAMPLGTLSRSMLGVAAERAAAGALATLGATKDEPRQLVRVRGGRVALSLPAVLAATRDLPGLPPAALLGAIGTGSIEVLAGLSRGASMGKRPLRGALHLGALAFRQFKGDRECGLLQRELQRDIRALGELDLGLLPTDGMATTFLRVEEVVGRVVELWSHVIAAQLSALLALGAILARRSPSSELTSALLATSGAGGTFGASMTLALARVVDVVRDDAPARAAIRAGVASLAALPDGPARGALGQFLSSYGDVAPRPFDLEVARWSDDPRSVLELVDRWLAQDGLARVAVEVAQERVRARADAELARHEPDLGFAERSLVRSLVERARRLARERASYERSLLRVLALARAVALDADRRLRRIEPAVRGGAVFACPFERVVAAFRGGRPELASAVLLHDHEASLLVRETEVERLGGFASAERSDASSANEAQRGIGVSSGVIDGVVSSLEVPDAATSSGIVVARALDVAAIPACFLVGGALCETGGALSPVAESLRELGVPAVFSLEGAVTWFGVGDRVRIDGTRGLVQRLTPSGASPRS
ncbi:MAG: hypothetical protein FJ096_00200 [Deltaproteobacteria bacterium]|nr:hypothetical protein [Deltaproteobacteria bacterium]